MSPAANPSNSVSIRSRVGNTWKARRPSQEEIKRLDGRNVDVTGYMFSLDNPQKATRFVLVPSLWGCCYGKPPEVNHVVLIKLPEGYQVKYYGNPSGSGRRPAPRPARMDIL